MKETHAAGLKEFFISVVWAAILFVMGGSTSYALPVFKIISGIGTFLLFCVFAFFVLTRYSAVFTYSLNENTLRVNRQIGHRNKEVEIRVGKIKSISAVDPQIKPTYRMRKYILRNKRDCYITFENKGKTECLLFCPSDDMLKKIKKASKKDGKNL